MAKDLRKPSKRLTLNDAVTIWHRYWITPGLDLARKSLFCEMTSRVLRETGTMPAVSVPVAVSWQG